MPQVNLNLNKKLFAEKFFPYLQDYTKRWEVYYGGAGSGKSYFITQKIIIRCCREPIRVLVCRRYASTLRNTCFALFKEVIIAFLPVFLAKDTEASTFGSMLPSLNSPFLIPTLASVIVILSIFSSFFCLQ